MAISSYVSESGETLWKGYVNVRSKTSPALRAQRRFSGIRFRRDAEREETRLIRECERELFEKESQGALWGSVVGAFDSYLQSPSAEKLNERTRLDYVASVRKHIQVFWKRAASEITPGEFRDLFQQLKPDGLSGAHLNKVKVVINRIYQFGIERSLIQRLERSPTYGIRFK